MDRKKRLLNRILLVSGASAVLLLLGYVWYLKRAPRHYHIPEGFSGWVTVRFEKPGAPPLRDADGALHVDIPPTGIVETSTRLKEGWARDAFYIREGGTETEISKTEKGADGTRKTRIHDMKTAKMRYDSIIYSLPDGSDTTLWDGARISKQGNAVNVRDGRATLLHFYYSPQPQPFFFPHDSLPEARMYW